jgi:hypothetical protein
VDDWEDIAAAATKTIAAIGASIAGAKAHKQRRSFDTQVLDLFVDVRQLLVSQNAMLTALGEKVFHHDDLIVRLSDGLAEVIETQRSVLGIVQQALDGHTSADNGSDQLGDH